MKKTIRFFSIALVCLMLLPLLSALLMRELTESNSMA